MPVIDFFEELTQIIYKPQSHRDAEGAEILILSAFGGILIKIIIY